MYRIIIGAVAITDGSFGRSNNTVILVGYTECSSSEKKLGDCDIQLIPVNDGRELYKYLNVSGVSCARVYSSSIPPAATIPPAPRSGKQTESNTGMEVGLGLVVTALVVAVAVIIGYCNYIEQLLILF